MWLIVATVSFTVSVLTLGVSIVLSIQWDVSKLIKVFFSKGVATSRGSEQTSSLMTTQTLLTDSVSVTKDITEKTTLTKEHIGEQVDGEPKPSESVEIKGDLSKSLNKVKTAFKPKGSSTKKKELKKQSLSDTSFNTEQDENQGNSNPSFVVVGQKQNLNEFDSELEQYPKIKSSTTLLSSLEEPKTTDVSKEDNENATQLLDDELGAGETTLLENLFETDEDEVNSSHDSTEVETHSEADLEVKLEDEEQGQTTILTEQDGANNLTEDSEVTQDQTSILDDGELEVYGDGQGKTSQLEQTNLKEDAQVTKVQDNTLDDWGSTGVVPTQSGGIDEVLGGKITLNLDNVTETDDSDSDELEEVDMRGKTQIITDAELQGKYKKELLTEEDTMEFHTFEVLEVVTSYNSYIR